jgi:Rrf2 family protein
MKISYKGDYALKIILDLALTYGRITPIRDISKRQDIPEKFLEQIITILKGAGLVKTVRGKNGGVALAKPPALITLGEVIRLVEGFTSPISCVSGSAYSRCNFEHRCAFRQVFDDIRGRINAVVDHTTFQDIVEKTRQLEADAPIDYVI